MYIYKFSGWDRAAFAGSWCKCQRQGLPRANLAYDCGVSQKGMHTHKLAHLHTRMYLNTYEVATISRLLKIIGLFCKRALQKRRYSAKETYDFKEPTNRSHPIHVTTYNHTYAYIQTQTPCWWLWRFKDRHTHIHTCACICTYIYIRTHIHTFTHIYTFIQTQTPRFWLRCFGNRATLCSLCLAMWKFSKVNSLLNFLCTMSVRLTLGNCLGTGQHCETFAGSWGKRQSAALTWAYCSHCLCRQWWRRGRNSIYTYIYIYTYTYICMYMNIYINKHTYIYISMCIYAYTWVYR